MGQQCLIDFVYRAAVRDLKLVISFIFDFFHMAANAGTDSGRNFCGRNAGEMVADSGTFSGGLIGMGESKEDVVDMLLELREIQPEALPINFLLPIKGTPLGDADISVLTTEYCMKVLCLARLLVPKADIRCAAGREVYFKGEEKKLLSVVDSIFASGYLTEGGQGIEDTLKTITDAGFTYEIESA